MSEKYIIVMDKQTDGVEMFFMADGVFGSDIKKAKQMSFDESENVNIKLQLSGIKNWIISLDEG